MTTEEDNKKIRQQKIHEMSPDVEALFKDYGYSINEADLRNFLEMFLWTFPQIYNPEEGLEDTASQELVEMAIALGEMGKRWNQYSSISAKDQFGNGFTIKEKDTINILYGAVKSALAHHYYKIKDHSIHTLKDECLKELRQQIIKFNKIGAFYNKNDFCCGSSALRIIDSLEERNIFNARKNKERTGKATGQNKEYAFIYDLFVIAKKIPHNNAIVDNIDKRDVIRSFINTYISHCDEYYKIYE
ncbi:MAG: hypothetical protein PHE92_08115 [Candidatus Cloacimonetes bacterium]|jgi:hypothetical protein|nr:hypothetical protein [Candidatus Cloacimonadota bacterium]